MKEHARVSVWRAIGDDLSHHFSIRHRVFVVEQQALEFTDLDVHDLDLDTVHVLAAHGDQACGTVRLYPLENGTWQGDRLAVLPSHRSTMVGADLVRFAVAWAGSRGGQVMHAQIQLPNVRFFERLGWARFGAPAPYCGFDHQPMTITLSNPAELHWPPRPADLFLEEARSVPGLLAG